MCESRNLRPGLRHQQAHAVDIQFLTAHVFLAHVHNAFHAEQAQTVACYAVLSGAVSAMMRFLPMRRPGALDETVVDLVRAGVQQILTFEVILARQAGWSGGLPDKARWTSGVVLQQRIELA